MYIPCPYDEAIQSRVCGCRQSRLAQVGERGTTSCSNADAHRVCVDLLNNIRKKANFALALTQTSGALPHKKAIKVQCGGLLGLQNTLDREETTNRVDNIYGLIQRALRRFRDLDQLPYTEIMRTISTYQHRKSRVRSV